jgi:hypothetical protein
VQEDSIAPPIPSSRSLARVRTRSETDEAIATWWPRIAATTVVVVSFGIYLLCNRTFNAGRGDLLFLADAFLNGRTWLTRALGPYDNVVIDGRVYVPFGPFPAILAIPLVALVGPAKADTWQPILNAGLAALDVGLAWALAARIGVPRLRDRFWLAILLGFSTAIWWVTTRGGVWHTGHLVASMLTLLALIELFGERRAWLVGLLAGAAFLTRAPVIFAMPVYALWFLSGRPRRPDPAPMAADSWQTIETSGVGTIGRGGAVGRGGIAWPGGWSGLAAAVERKQGRFATWPIRDWAGLAIGFLPALVFFLWYNDVRFGSPFESGYGLAGVPPFLVPIRQQGLFSIAHLGMNLDYLLWHLPKLIPDFPFFRPDGLGMSILLTSPGLLLAVRAPWRDPRARLLAAGFVLTLLPSLFYYGGGWLQFGYRYALDAIPFAIALAALAAMKRGVGLGWWILLVIGLLVNAAGVYWAYHL